MDDFFTRLKSTELIVNRKIMICAVLLMVVIIAVPIMNFAFLLEEDWLNVHLIPHTHDDVGWIKTPEQYYDSSVKFIISNVIEELQKNPSRKFVYVETYFLWKWWQDQTEVMRNVLRALIHSKQLEIAGGGYCMSDEAVTHYQSFIDQSTWGLRLVNDTFGPVASPTVAWQIDTFGHSKGIASLFAQMGFESLFFARLDYREKAWRLNRGAMEFIWKVDESIDDFNSIFTSIFYDHYSAPKGFDFENQAREEKINFSGFYNYVRTQSEKYATNNVIVPMGDDFRYENAKKYFEKMDELIGFFQSNSHFKINVFYSSPATYIEYLKEADLIWPDKRNDFFPYATEVVRYWTGFYTSRPTLKYFARMSNRFLQVSKQLLVLANMGVQYSDDLTKLREAVGVIQHHDGITGTSQQHVTDHYVKLMYDAVENCATSVDQALGKLSTQNDDFGRPLYKSCLYLNVSSCDVTENSVRFVVTVYNPLSRTVDYYVRVPVTRRSYSVFAGNGSRLTSQMVAIPRSVRSVPGRKSRAKAELVFKASSIPAMGFKSFYVSGDVQEENYKTSENEFETTRLKAVFDSRSQLLSGFKTKSNNFSVTQTLRYYESVIAESGAYVFSTRDQKTCPVSRETPVATKLLNNGRLVKEYEQVFSRWASQIIRVFHEEDFVEFEWLVGPIPINDGTGKDVVSVYTSGIASGDIFYTDVNGLDMQKRMRNSRDWKRKVRKSIEGNYYPVTTMISIRDTAREMVVVVDRPQGGGSLKSGQIELMVHRRHLEDDGLGVSEALNEVAYGVGLVARGRHWLLFGERGVQMSQKAKLFSESRHLEPWLFFLDASSMPFGEWRTRYITEFSGLFNYVPRNVRILTLEPWRPDTILLRLEHIFKKLPVPSLSNSPVLIYLKNLFRDFEVVEARETALGADRWLSDVGRFKWRSVHSSGDGGDDDVNELDDIANLTISLRPRLSVVNNPDNPYSVKFYPYYVMWPQPRRTKQAGRFFNLYLYSIKDLVQPNTLTKNG